MRAKFAFEVQRILNEVNVVFSLQVVLEPEDGVWVGLCPSIDLASQAEKEDSPLTAIKEAVAAWFESCLERGDLAAALEECGFARIAHPAETLADS